MGKLFGVSSATVANWCNRGELKFSRIGRGPRKISRCQVEAFIKDNKIQVGAMDPDILKKVRGKEDETD